jgi:putative Mg2+ transporter-C (MgtC) family protein
MFDVLWQELTSGLHDSKQLARVVIRLVAAAALGGLVGIQRQTTHKPAGLRTHMLVSAGTAALVVAAASGGLSVEGWSRVIQGIETGIGFIGAGTILKISQEHAIKGLTTAASVWMTAAIGVSVGLGNLGIGIMVTLLALLILWLWKVEHNPEDKAPSQALDHPDESNDE